MRVQCSKADSLRHCIDAVDSTSTASRMRDKRKKEMRSTVDLRNFEQCVLVTQQMNYKYREQEMSKGRPSRQNTFVERRHCARGSPGSYSRITYENGRSTGEIAWQWR